MLRTTDYELLVKLLFLIPNLDYHGAAKQLMLLALGLPRQRFTLRVCTFGPPTPWAETLRAAGVEVEAFCRERPFDPGSWLRLGRSVRRFRPDIVHTWGLAALGIGLCLRRWSGGRLVISAGLPVGERPPRPGWFEQWAARCGDYHVIVGGSAEAERWRLRGTPEDRIVQIPPGVVESPAEAVSVRESLGLPAGVRLLVGIGPVERHKGFYDAVWGLDILKYLYDDLHLVLVGRGPDRPRVERFARALRVTDQVHWVGPQADVRPILNEAEVVWVPSRAPAGINAALEAMAAGRPVVAACLPELAEIVTDGETGVLFTPGNKAMLARQTRILLDDADQRRQMGEAGRKRAATRFPVSAMVHRHAELYARLV